jgi:hypothetical protein
MGLLPHQERNRFDFEDRRRPSEFLDAMEIEIFKADSEEN